MGTPSSSFGKRDSSNERADKAERSEKLREADAEIDASTSSPPSVLQLAKNARSLWERRSDDEKRDLLAKLVCSP